MNELILLEDLGYLYPTSTSKQKAKFGLYKCYCGKEFKTRIQDVKNKLTQSCGCLRKVKKTTHGFSNHRLYGTWKMMIDRCSNIKNNKYNLYGGRGIIVCDEWLNIENFINDMYPSYIEGLTIDRINPNGNYKKDNCRWATQTMQTRNTISTPNHNTSGKVGVYFNKKNKKWIANICIANKTKYIGSFISIEDAQSARNTFIIANNLEHTIRI